MVVVSLDIDILDLVGLAHSYGDDAITEDIKSRLVVEEVCSEFDIHDASVSWEISGGSGTTVTFRVEVYPS
jgi:hypothetical protein